MPNTKNKKIIWILFILLILTVINSDRIYNLFSHQEKTILIADRNFKVEIADTEAKRERGLSGRKNLDSNTGMLFIFDHPDFYNFWMKEMNFPIDIIWLDQNKKIVDLTENLQPTTFPKTFTSKIPAQYIIELKTGEIKNQQLKIGQQVKF